MKPKSKWWGWGNPDTTYHLEEHPLFLSYLKTILELPDKAIVTRPNIQDIKIREIRLSGRDIDGLYSILTPEGVDHSDEARITNAYGKSYKDLIRIRLKQFDAVPDAVVFPKSESEVRDVLHWAADNKIEVIPRGGGTSVVGGVETTDAHRATIVIDMHRMNRVLAVDTLSLVADVEPGIYGPALENSLQKHGVTLSHYPESFEYSTLGGWIAARSAGQQSTLYGKIEDMVESLTIATPDGVIKTVNVPAAANGPELTRLLIGSEGIFGIITQARIKLRPVPAKKYYTGYLFKSFNEGIECCRDILQRGLTPAAIRLSDADETNFAFSLIEPAKSAVKNIIHKTGFAWMQSRGYVEGKRAFLLLGLEGTASRVSYERRTMRSIIRQYDGIHVGRGSGKQWYRQRFINPYRRDVLLDYGLMVDTLETATEWSNVPYLHHEVLRAINSSFGSLNIKGAAFAHLSHLYTAGSSIYYIILASPHRGKELEEWNVIKNAACDTILRNGGTISHHHGVGLDHRRWLKKEIGDAGIRLLKDIKTSIDPNSVLNPGKIIE